MTKLNYVTPLYQIDFNDKPNIELTRAEAIRLRDALTTALKIAAPRDGNKRKAKKR
jgi:hypothetical protein